MTATDPVETFLLRVWNERDFDLLDGLMVEPYAMRAVDGSMVKQLAFSRHDMVRHVQEWLEGFPDLQMQISQRSDGGAGSTCLVRCTGTQTGPFNGLDPSGRPVDFHMAVFFDVDGTRLTGHTTLVDRLTLRAQLATD